MSQALRPDTHEQQRRLADYCRTGEEAELQGITPDRVHHYRRLVFNIAKDALTRTYPLAVNLLTEKEWGVLCHHFFEHHPCQDPQVWKMPFELIGHVVNEQHELIRKYPHLPELLHFEWKEVEYYMMADRPSPAPRGDDWWEDPWPVNPESEVLSLSYPVHIKNARLISRTDQGRFYCLVFRQPETGKVRFMNLSPFFAWLIEQLKQEGSTPALLFPSIREQFGMEDPEFLKLQLTPFVDKLRKDGMLINRDMPLDGAPLQTPQ